MVDAIRILANLVPLVALAASVAMLFRLFQKHIDGRPLVEFEPRRPVPWNALAPAVVLVLTLPTLVLALAGTAEEAREHATAEAAALASSIAGGSAAGAPVAAYESSLVQAAAVDAWSPAIGELTSPTLGLMSLVQVVITLAFYVTLAGVFGATRDDLGLPGSWQQVRRDAALGGQTFLACIAPVYGIQVALTFALEPTEVHPLIEQLQVVHTPLMLLAAFVVAALAAPLYEETAFRLILQGWLERVQMMKGRESTLAATTLGVIPGSVEEPAIEFGSAAPETRAVSPLPGWAPMVISGSLFALAHLGHGVAPVSLLPLGLALGYVYQRTHRVLPSIVCHALFNGFSLLVLWLALAGGEP